MEIQLLKCFSMELSFDKKTFSESTHGHKNKIRLDKSVFFKNIYNLTISESLQKPGNEL